MPPSTPTPPTPKKTHSNSCGNLLFALGALRLLLPIGPAVLWRLLVRAPAAFGLAVPGSLVNYVEQMERALVLPVGALGLAPLVAVLAGGVVPPAQLYAGAQTLHDGAVQLRHGGAPGGGGHRPVADPAAGHRSHADTQHGHESPGSGLSGGRLSHARRGPRRVYRD